MIHGETYSMGDRVVMFEYFPGTVQDYNPQNIPFYTVLCDRCKGLHQVWESDLQPEPEEDKKEHEPVGD